MPSITIVAFFLRNSNTKHSSSNDKSVYVAFTHLQLFFLSGSAAIWNFRALHMKSLGLSPSEIGIIVGFPGLVGAVVVPAAGKSDVPRLSL